MNPVVSAELKTAADVALARADTATESSVASALESAPRFKLEGLVTNAEIEQLCDGQRHMRAIFEKIEPFNPDEMRKVRRAAIVSAEKSPGVAAVESLIAVSDESYRDENAFDRYRQLRRAAMHAVWDFYDQKQRPLLIAIFERARERVSQEKAKTLTVETDWRAAMQPWVEFANFYAGAQLALTGLPSESLDHLRNALGAVQASLGESETRNIRLRLPRDPLALLREAGIAFSSESPAA